MIRAITPATEMQDGLLPQHVNRRSVREAEPENKLNFSHKSVCHTWSVPEINPLARNICLNTFN